MNIGLSTLVIQRGRSGVGQYVLAITRALMDHTPRHQFTLFVLEDDLPLFRFASSAMSLVPVPETVRPPLQSIAWHQTELPRLARRLQLEILHIPSYRRMLWPRPCALVSTIHDLAPFRVPGKYDRLRMLYGRVVARWLAQRQDEIIAVSQTTAQDIARFFRVPADRVTVVHNGVDHTRFTPGPPIEAKVFAARHGVLAPVFLARFFLYVARLEHPGKNHVRLIEAFNRFKAETRLGWQLVLGGSDWHGAEVIREQIRNSPYARDIHCLGFVPDADLPTWYRAADVFVYPSLYEGFGLPPVEAMACGCPVLCSNRGALAEVAGRAAVLVDPENVGELTTELIHLATDADRRERLRQAGLVHAEQFTWHRTAGATLEVYARAATRTSRSRSAPEAHRTAGRLRAQAARLFRHLP